VFTKEIEYTDLCLSLCVDRLGPHVGPEARMGSVFMRRRRAPLARGQCPISASMRRS
jgi:hypothetical protein